MIQAAAGSRIGGKHPVNEDTFLVDDEVGLYIVADGMGGQQAGEVASQMTVELMASFIDQSQDSEEITWPFGIDPKLPLDSNRLRTAAKLANRRVWKQADEHDEYLGMGSTIVAALVNDGSLTLCAAGDSRAYRIRGGAIEQLTEDDSWIRVAISEGLASREKASKHPMRNLITKAIGANEELDPQLMELEIEDGDTFLLCSDGVHKAVDDEALLGCASRSDGDLQAAVESILDTAAANGTDDDSTALLLRFHDS